MERGHELTRRLVEKFGNFGRGKARKGDLADQREEILPTRIATLAQFQRRIGVSGDQSLELLIAGSSSARAPP